MSAKARDLSAHMTIYLFSGLQIKTKVVTMPRGVSLGVYHQVPGTSIYKGGFIANGFCYVINKWINGGLYVRYKNYRLTRCQCRGKLVEGQIIQTSIEDHMCLDNNN
jgi:hypothetical protein